MGILNRTDHGHPAAAGAEGIPPLKAWMTNILPHEQILIALLALCVSVLVVYQKLALFLLILLSFLVFLSFIKTSWLLYLTIFTVAFKHAIRGFVPQHIFFGRTLLPGDALLVFLVAGLFFKVIVESRKGFLSQKIDRSVIIFTIIIAYGFLYGILNGYHNVFRASRGLLFYLPLPFLIVYFQNLDNRQQERHAFINFLFFFFISVNFLSILVSLGYLNVLFHSKHIGHSLGFYRPNKIIDTVLSLPAIFFSLFVLKQYQSKAYIALATVSLILGIGSLMVSVTRGFLIGFVITALVLAFISKKGSFFSFRVVGASILLIPAMLFLMVGFNVDFISAYKLRFQQSQGITYRMHETMDYYYSFLESPIMGHGFGSPVTRYFSSGSLETSYAHNDYLFFLQTVGVLGLLALSWFIIRSIYVTYLAAKHSKTKDDLIISLLALSLLISLPIISVVAPKLRSFSTVPLLVTLISISYSIKSDNEHRETE